MRPAAAGQSHHRQEEGGGRGKSQMVTPPTRREMRPDLNDSFCFSLSLSNISATRFFFPLLSHTSRGAKFHNRFLDPKKRHEKSPTICNQFQRHSDHSLTTDLPIHAYPLFFLQKSSKHSFFFPPQPHRTWSTGARQETKGERGRHTQDDAARCLVNPKKQGGRKKRRRKKLSLSLSLSLSPDRAVSPPSFSSSIPPSQRLPHSSPRA